MKLNKEEKEWEYPFEVSRVTLDSSNTKEIIKTAGYSIIEPATERLPEEFFKSKETFWLSEDSKSSKVLLQKLHMYTKENFSSYTIIESGNAAYIVGTINRNYHMVICIRIVKTEDN